MIITALIQQSWSNNLLNRFLSPTLFQFHILPNGKRPAKNAVILLNLHQRTFREKNYNNNNNSKTYRFAMCCDVYTPKIMRNYRSTFFCFMRLGLFLPLTFFISLPVSFLPPFQFLTCASFRVECNERELLYDS